MSRFCDVESKCIACVCARLLRYSIKLSLANILHISNCCFVDFCLIFKYLNLLFFSLCLGRNGADVRGGYCTGGICPEGHFHGHFVTIILSQWRTHYSLILHLCNLGLNFSECVKATVD